MGADGTDESRLGAALRALVREEVELALVADESRLRVVAQRAAEQLEEMAADTKLPRLSELKGLASSLRGALGEG